MEDVVGFIKLGLVLFLLFILSACGKPSGSNAGNTSMPEEPPLEGFSKVEDYNPEQAQAESKKEDTVKEKTKETVSEKIETPKVKLEKPKPKKPFKRPKKKIAIIEFDSLVYHLPPLDEGDKVSLNFGFTNTGDAPLQIKTAEVSCGCTTPNIPFLDIEPGERGNIGVDYNSVNKYGHQEPEITITTNGKPKTVVLKVSVDIIEKPKKDTIQKDTLSN